MSLYFGAYGSRHLPPCTRYFIIANPLSTRIGITAILTRIAVLNGVAERPVEHKMLRSGAFNQDRRAQRDSETTGF